MVPLLREERAGNLLGDEHERGLGNKNPKSHCVTGLVVQAQDISNLLL